MGESKVPARWGKRAVRPFECGSGGSAGKEKAPWEVTGGANIAPCRAAIEEYDLLQGSRKFDCSS